MDSVMRARQSLHEVLREIDWAGEPGSMAATYRVGFGPTGAPVSDVVIGIDGTARMLMLLARFAPAAPAGQREAVTHCLNSANWNLMLGNFEMDAGSGAVRYRSSVPFGDGELPPSAIRGAILGAMEIVEAHAPAIAAAITGREGA